MFSELTKFQDLLPVTPPEKLTDLDPRLRIFEDDVLQVWYAPLGKAKQNPTLWILGITPGCNQMRIAYKTAAECLSAGLSHKEAAESQKPQVAFAGSMRTNLISMMDNIGFANMFRVKSTSQIFETEHVRTGSVLKYPVFRNGKNYAGHSPSPTSHEVLREMLDVVLAKELEEVGDCLILPLGKTVEACLQYSASKVGIGMSNVLCGFRHPSGANGHRRRQFSDRHAELSRIVRSWSRNVP